MANAKKCDRCGAYYQEAEPNAAQELVDNFLKYITPQSIDKQISAIEGLLDLCPSCSKSLKRWVNGEEKEDGK